MLHSLILARRVNLKDRQLADPQPATQPFITGFSVENLFGLYSYKVDLPNELSDNEKRLLIIYGDNGSGKTTLINIIHHTLSHESKKGHRSFLANTRFDKFRLNFSDGKILEIEKEYDTGLGSYYIRLLFGREILKDVHVASRRRDDQYVVSGEDLDDEEINSLFSILYETQLSVMTLTDNREFQSDSFETDDDDALHYRANIPYDLDLTTYRKLRLQRVGSVGHQVNLSIQRAEEWIRRQTLAARSRNDESVASIYTQLIRTFGTVLAQPPEQLETTIDQLMSKVDELSKQVEGLSDLGFTTAIPRDDLYDAITSLAPEHIPTVGKLLQPYFDSIEARVQGLLPIANRLTVFSDIVNEFFRSKTFSLNAVRGIEIESRNGEPISPQMLSSGEKHLLLMLCNILVGTSGRSLFLIDEPELSLNVKWQRELIASLLELSEGSSVQFIMATHSIELLSQHQNCTMHLKND